MIGRIFFLLSLLASSAAFGQTCAINQAVPLGTSCGVTDFSVGGPISDSDSMIICQQGGGGCPGNASVVKLNQQSMSGYATYFRSKLSGVAPITYNSTTGAFGLATDSTLSVVGGQLHVATGTGGGGVNNAAMGQVAFYASTTNVGGNTGLTFSSGGLTIGAPAAPTPALGTGDLNIQGRLLINGSVAGGVTVPATTMTISASDWAAGHVYTITTSGQTITFPASNTLSANGGVTIMAVGGAATLHPNAGDQINGATADFTVPPGTVSVVTSDGAGHLYASGEAKIFPLSWGPGMNLSAAPIPLITRNFSTTVTSISCTIGNAGTGVLNIDVYYAADGASPTSVKLTGASTPCNGAGVANTQQVGLLDPAKGPVPAGAHIWVVGSGAGWATSTNFASFSGKVQVSMTP